MKVKIKSWGQMAQEFGLNPSGDIYCEGLYTKRMEDAMSENRIIHVTRRSRFTCEVYAWYPNNSNCVHSTRDMYHITPDMIEEYL